MVVEDEADNRDLLVFALENEGARVTAVESANEALETLERAKPDLIICDIHLPEKDGCELLQEWREREIDLGLFPVPAIAVTGFASEQDKQRAYDSGFQFHVTKPYDVIELPCLVANFVAAIRTNHEEASRTHEQFR